MIEYDHTAKKWDIIYTYIYDRIYSETVFEWLKIKKKNKIWLH